MTSTSDVDEIVATEADIVVYMASVERNKESCFADVTRLLASGKNVVATGSSFIDPVVFDADLGARLAEAATKARVSFLGLGLFPGFWGESIAHTRQAVPALWASVDSRIAELRRLSEPRAHVQHDGVRLQGPTIRLPSSAIRPE